MSTDAELAGSIDIDETPFVRAMETALIGFETFANTLKNKGKTLTDPIDAAFKELGVKSHASLDKAANDAVIAFERIRNSGKATAQDISNAYAAMQGKIAAATGTINSETQKSAAAFQGLSSSAVATGVIIANMATSVINRITSMASSALDSGISFLRLREQATTAFTNLLGSAEKAKSFIGELAAFANKTPFEMPELVKAAQKFTAMGFSAKEVIPILTSVGNAVAAMGGTSEMVDRVTVALVQMKAKGKVSAQEMMQLAEAGIPAWQILAEKIGVSIPEAMKLGEKGAINATMAIEALTEGMDKRFGGMMEKQSHTFAGLMSTIHDTSQQVLGSVLEPLFKSATETMQIFVNILPDVQKGIEGMTDQVKLATVAFVGLGLATGAAATAIAVTLGGPAALAVAGLGIQVAALTAAILSNFGQIGSAIAAWTGDTQINFATVLRWIGMGADGFAIFARSILVGVDIIGTALVVMGQSFKGVMGILQGFATSVKGVLTFDPTAIVTGISQMQGAWTKFDTGVSTQINAFTQRLKTNMQSTVDNLNGKYANGFQSAGVKIGAAFTEASNKAGEFVKSLGELGKKGNQHGEDLMGGKGAKKGKDDTQKLLKEQLDFVNSWLKETGQALELGKAVWAGLAKATKDSLLEVSFQFHKSISDAQAWAAQLQVAFLNAAQKTGDVSKALVVTLKGTKIKIVDPVIEAISHSGVLGGAITKGIEIPAYLKFVENAQFKEAAQRTLFDVLKIQTDAQDKSKDSAAKHQAELAKQAEANNKLILEQARRTYDRLEDIVGEGMAGVLAQLAKFGGISLGRMTDVAEGIIDVIGGIPGKIGDKLRSATNKVLDFVNGIDRTLKGLHKIFNQIPDGLSGVIEKITGLFKSGSSTWGKSFDDFWGGVQKSTAKGGSALLGSLGKIASTAAGILGGIGTFMGSRNQGKAVGILGGAMGGLSAGASIGALFGPMGAGIGAAIGAGAGALLGLFGSGKSQAQKEAEKRAIDQEKANLAKTYEDIKAGMIQTMQEGAKLLESLAGFVEVPRKAIKRFVNQLGLVLELFLDESKRLAAIGLTQGKEVVDNLGDAFNFMLSGADLINAIKDIATITEKNISDFISTTVTIIKKWAEAAATIELQSAKFTGKISDKLKTSFEFLSIVPDVIKGFGESALLSDAKIDLTFTTMQKIIQGMKKISEEERGLELNKAGSSAGIFATIFESMKGMLDLFAQLSAYKPLENTVLDAITSDLKKLLAWGDSLIALGASGIAKFETLGDVIARMASAMKSATSGISALTGGGFSSSVTYEGAGGMPTYGSSAGSYTKGAMMASPYGRGTSPSSPVSVSITVQGSLYADGDFLRRIRAEVEEALRMRDAGFKGAAIAT